MKKNYSSEKRRLLTLAALTSLATMPFFANEPVWDTKPDTWVGMDEQKRVMPTSDSGCKRTEIDPNTSVGVFYHILHGQHEMKWDKDITELLAENPDDPAWGPEGLIHWGSTPWIGRYRGEDEYKIERHFQWLTDAGVNFICFDATNAFTYDNVALNYFEECKRREELGLRNLQITYMCHSYSLSTLVNLYNNIYKAHPEYEKYWFKWQGKPLILCVRQDLDDMIYVHYANYMNEERTDEERNESLYWYNLLTEIKDFFTIRDSWAYEQADPDRANEWSWMEYTPQNPGFTLDADGNKVTEYITVGAAQLATLKISKSSSNNHGTYAECDKYGRHPDTPKGLYFQEQWDRALRVHPPVVMVSSWNEHVAQRFIVKNESEILNTRPGVPGKIGESYFVDVYTPEYSRDIEPNRDRSVRDNYYMQLCMNVRNYRGVNPIPEPAEALTIDIDGDFAQWDGITLEFLDDIDDTFYRSELAETPDALKRATNDIIRAKVSKDADNYYFYVETAQPLSDFAASDNWMRLFINADCDYENGWFGHDYMCCKDAETGTYSLMKNLSGKRVFWRWKKVADLNMRYEGNKMMVAVPRSLLSDKVEDTDIDFKWADNLSEENIDVMRFLSDGDTAPNERFCYRYKGSAIATPNAGITGVAADSRTGGICVASCNGKTTFTDAAGNSVRVNVFDAQGRLIDGDTSACTLSAGVYVATAGGKSVKFTVK